MDGWAHASEAAKAFLEQHGLLAAALFLFVDEAGVPTPFPGNVLIVALGVAARDDAAGLLKAAVVFEVVTVAGATLLYALSRWTGRRAVLRWGRRVGLTRQRLRGAERRVRRHSFRAVVAARLVPGLRIVTAVAAGVLDVPPQVFVPAVSVGAFIYIVACLLLGYVAGPGVERWLEHLRLW